MIRPLFLFGALSAVACLAACANGAGLGRGQTSSDLGAEIFRGAQPTEPPDACWANDETPAVIETVTDQIAEVASDNLDAGFRTETRQNIVQPREKFWFRTPCEEQLTPDVVTTLQRALAARAVFAADVTGKFDPATRAAIRAYQSPRGLSSDRLSLAAAQDLGVIAVDLGQVREP